MKLIKSESIRDAWSSAFQTILTEGYEIFDESVKLKECLDLFLSITKPLKDIENIEEVDREYEEWMQNNFEQVERVPKLKNCWSYGWRLYNYNGIDQVQWVIDRLKSKPESKSATISMLQVAGSESYIPCVSLLDFKIRNNQLLLSVTARSLDFGKKAIFNFINLAKIAEKVAQSIGISSFHLNIHVISAHVYEKDWKTLEK
jgi:thymidylate synthase